MHASTRGRGYEMKYCRGPVIQVATDEVSTSIHGTVVNHQRLEADLRLEATRLPGLLARLPGRRGLQSISLATKRPRVISTP
jgi:hypothetical protein